MAGDGAEKARQRLAREQGTIIKDWGGRIPIALVYPNTYYIGMSNLGVHAIYSLLNGYSGVVCERAFWENSDRKLPTLSLESQRPLSDFAILAFSITIHEFGHFLIAKLFKIPVEKFSIGYGPPLIRKKIGETDFRIAYFPLGGYVKIAGEDEGIITQKKHTDEDAESAVKHRTAEGTEYTEAQKAVPDFYEAPIYKRVLIVLSGVGAIPGLGKYLPNQLITWATGLMTGAPESYWPALWISAGLIVAALFGAWLIFERQEL